MIAFRASVEGLKSSHAPRDFAPQSDMENEQLPFGRAGATSPVRAATAQSPGKTGAFCCRAIGRGFPIKKLKEAIDKIGF